jgi:cytochrome o ubiquinol oxidase subunit 2
MGGMATRLNLLADAPGEYPGISANFSGRDFSRMRFIVKAVPAADFDAWLTQVRSGGSAPLDDAGFAELAKPGTAAPATYSSVSPQLFDRVINRTATGPAQDVGAAWCPPQPREGR